MNPLPSAANRKVLSPSSARFDALSGERATMVAAFSSAAPSAGSGSGPAGPTSLASPTVTATTATATAARRNRGASPWSANCHHISPEYSTWRKARRPSQNEAPSTTAIATNQPPVKRSASRAPLR